LTATELLERLRNEEKLKNLSEKEKREEISAAKTELNKRISFSLASFAFALVGVPLAITAHRKETSVGFLMSLGVAVIYFFFIIVANSLREKENFHPELLMWLPNVLCIGFGGWLFYRMSRR